MSEDMLIEGAVRLASAELTNQAPLYEYWQHADDALRDKVIDKAMDQLQRFWQATTAETYSEEWYMSISQLCAMAQDIFYDVLEEIAQRV
ncbi:hypothetical protein BYT27DRAFT_7249437 [Phlegmacium glaucopus]|nr:hypothetical protein BYT27DRAFT_7249437 [Phlegmacium glaucopus]